MFYAYAMNLDGVHASGPREGLPFEAGELCSWHGWTIISEDEEQAKRWQLRHSKVVTLETRPEKAILIDEWLEAMNSQRFFIVGQGPGVTLPRLFGPLPSRRIAEELIQDAAAHVALNRPPEMMGWIVELWPPSQFKAWALLGNEAK